MNDIFISYAREDKETAKRLALALIDQGYDVWWDPEIPGGKHYDDVIEQALEDTCCVLVLWSKNSVASRWVRREASKGQEHEILIPILINKCKIPFRFDDHQTDDLSAWNGDSTDSSFTKLLADIYRQVKSSKDTKAEKPPQQKLMQEKAQENPEALQKRAKAAKRKKEQEDLQQELMQEKLQRKQDKAAKRKAALKAKKNRALEVPSEEEQKTQWPFPLSGSKALEESLMRNKLAEQEPVKKEIQFPKNHETSFGEDILDFFLDNLLFNVVGICIVAVILYFILG